MPDPVAAIRDAILEAVRLGGGYVNVPSPRLRFGTDILFSPGMTVSWTRMEVPDEPLEPHPVQDLDFTDL
jgi:hypothetical protein